LNNEKFSAITYLTVGYGDLAPATSLLRVPSGACAAAGIATVGMVIASLITKVTYR
jgi:Ion channel